MDHHAFFDALWADYADIAPAAASIRDQLVAAGETVLNDHVAFRTYDRGPIALDHLEPHLLALGYERYAPYRFEEKKLRAFGYVHATDPDAPKVFLSELETAAFPAWLGEIVDELVAQVPADFVQGPEVFYAGRPWAPVDHATYEKLLDVSEYAAWVAAVGLRANHFTIFVNRLSEGLRGIPAILDWVEDRGFRINESGGRIKGGPDVLLEQGSTMADAMPLAFADGEHVVPTCYYEFAQRWAEPGGGLYQGFVAASADRIFESTNVR